MFVKVPDKILMFIQMISFFDDISHLNCKIKKFEFFSVCRISPLIVSTFQEISSIDSFGQSWNTAAIDRL